MVVNSHPLGYVRSRCSMVRYCCLGWDVGDALRDDWDASERDDELLRFAVSVFSDERGAKRFDNPDVAAISGKNPIQSSPGSHRLPYTQFINARRLSRKGY